MNKDFNDEKKLKKMPRSSKGSMPKKHGNKKAGGGNGSTIAAGNGCLATPTANSNKGDSRKKKEKDKSKKKAKEETAKESGRKIRTYYRPYMDKKAVEDRLKKGSLIKVGYFYIFPPPPTGGEYIV